jgi:hypothetical protein
VLLVFVKEVLVGDRDAAKRFIVRHNPAGGDRDRAQREQTIARLQTELERITTARAKAKSPRLRQTAVCAGAGRAVRSRASVAARRERRCQHLEGGTREWGVFSVSGRRQP